MHPYNHSLSTAKKHGGHWSNYIKIHSWFDASKITYPHFLHRALRHHKEGIAEADKLFSNITDLSINEIGQQHMLEDCQFIPEAQDWLKDHNLKDYVPNHIPDPEDLACKTELKFGGHQEDYLDLHEWFLETKTWTSDNSHLILRHQSFGIFEAEEKFGVLYKESIPTRVIAEDHVKRVMGSLRAPAYYLSKLKSNSSWMNKAFNAMEL